MEHFDPRPTGATRTHTSGNSSGWRKVTPKTARTNQLAQTEPSAPVEKSRAMIALKRVAAHLGLKPADVLLMDTLAAFSAPQDWLPRQTPIVWPSNDYLMSRTGLSLSTIKRRLRRLVDLHLIACHDSPNGKRWGHRDARGHIVEAYGFSLAPLRAQTERFEALAQDLADARQQHQHCKREVTSLRRYLRAALDAMAPTDLTTKLTEKLETLLTTLKQSDHEALAKIREGLKALRQLVDKHLSDPGEIAKMTPKAAQNDPHIQTTNEEKIRNKPTVTRITPTTLKHSCPEFGQWCDMLGKTSATWADLITKSAAIAPMIGVPHAMWHRLKQELGDASAVTALALTFEKHQQGLVKTPAGYLRGMVAQAKIGALHLDRSVFGRLKHLETA